MKPAERGARGADRSPLPGAPPEEGGRRTDAERIAHVMDELVRIPGTRIRVGIDSFLGLLPGGGDLAGGLISAWIILIAARRGAPPGVLLRMGGNVLVDTIVGTIPLLGDLFDVAWKANRRNVALLGRYQQAPVGTSRASRVTVVLVLAVLVGLLVLVALGAVAALRWLIGVIGA